MDCSSQTLILCHRERTVLTITLNRPEKSNALSPELIKQLSTALAQAEGHADVNVVVITGAGRCFSAGLDLELLVKWSTEEKAAYLESAFQVFRRIWSMPQPVIAAVNGPAIAGGFDLAAFCDIRLASRTALFGQAEVKLGLTQVIHPLYKTIGLARAKELAMTGENINAEEAYRIGLVNHMYAPEELMSRAMALAATLAARPRNALFETKRLTRQLIDMPTETALQEMGATIRRCLESREHQKLVADLYASIKHHNNESPAQA